MTATKEALDGARRDLVAAVTNADGERVAELTERVGALASHQAMLEQTRIGAAQREAQAKHVYEETEQYFADAREVKKPAPPAPQQLTPEQWVAQFPRKTQAWLKAHPDYQIGGAKYDDLNSFATDWVGDYGQTTLHTPAFIEALDAQFDSDGSESEMTESEEEEKPQPQAKTAKAAKRATPAAPVSRGSGYFNSANLDAKKMRLPADVAEFVKSSGLNPESYAEGIRQDIIAGRKPKEWLDQGFDRQLG